MEIQAHSIHAFKPGTIFANRYRLLRLAGSGGFADVWQVEDIEVDNILALKIYARLDDDGKRELANEYKLLREINHPNLLRSEHFGSDGNIFYLEMRYCDGGNMSGKVGKLSTDEMRHVAQDICKGLEYLHQEGIVHQDIKPENILYDKKHNCYLLSDFGISSKSRTQLSKSVKLTDNTISMTASYAPPERFSTIPSDRVPDAKSDIFSLGVTLYELASGMLPVDLPQSIGQLMFISEGKQPVYYDAISDPLLRNVIQRCMNSRKDLRPAANELLEMFDASNKETKNNNNTNKHKTERIVINNDDTKSSYRNKSEVTKTNENHNNQNHNRKWIILLVSFIVILIVFVMLSRSRHRPDYAPDTAIFYDETSDTHHKQPKTDSLEKYSTPSGAQVKVDGETSNPSRSQHKNEKNTYSRQKAIEDAAMQICNCGDITNCVNNVINQSFPQYSRDEQFVAAAREGAKRCIAEKAAEKAAETAKDAAIKGAQKAIIDMNKQ